MAGGGAHVPPTSVLHLTLARPRRRPFGSFAPRRSLAPGGGSWWAGGKGGGGGRCGQNTCRVAVGVFAVAFRFLCLLAMPFNYLFFIFLVLLLCCVFYAFSLLINTHYGFYYSLIG